MKVVRCLLWVVILLGPAGAQAVFDDATMADLLRDAWSLAQAGDTRGAYDKFQSVHSVASANYERIEALGGLAAVTPAASEAQLSSLGLLMTYFEATPPRWVSDETRKLVSARIAERVASGRYAEQPPEPPLGTITFAGPAAGSAYTGSRYFWMVPLPLLRQPYFSAGFTRQAWLKMRDDRDVLARDVTWLPDGRYTVTDPLHVGRPDAAQWQFDRVLLGYSWEPMHTGVDEFGQEHALPREPWRAGQSGFWRLRFRVFYPSGLLATQDHGPLAHNLLDALLRAYWLGVQQFGRVAVDKDDSPQTLDAFLTERPAAPGHTAVGAERTYGALYFYQSRLERSVEERLREVFHEYSHAMLPPLGYYGQTQRYEPNMEGYLGELLLWRQFREHLRRTDEAVPEWPQAIRQELINGAPSAPPEWARLVRGFLTAGPQSELRAGQTDAAAEWLLGLGLWIQDTHRPEVVLGLYDGLRPATGEGFLGAYQSELNAQRGGFSLRLRHPEQRGDDGLQLLPEQPQTVLAYLPNALYSVRLLAAGTGQALLEADARTTLLRAGFNRATADPTAITGRGQWVRLRLTAAEAQPVQARQLLFDRLGR